MPNDPIHLLGIDIGGTRSAVLIGGADGCVIARREWPSRAERGPQAMIAEIVEHAHALMAECGGAISAVGVSIGGPLDYQRGVIHNPPNLPGWDAVPLRDILRDTLRLPVHVMHDAAACALAEYRWGAGRGCSRLAYLTCGTGLGVGLIFDGRPYAGVQGRFPEIGHVRLEHDGPTAFGKAGSIEAFCSGTGLMLTARWLYPQRWGDCPPRGPQLSQLAQQGDADAIAVLHHSADCLGRVCAMLGDMLMLDRIVVGSLGRYLGEQWLDRVRHVFRAEVLPFVAENCVIATAGLAERLQDCSALAAADVDQPSGNHPS